MFCKDTDKQVSNCPTNHGKTSHGEAELRLDKLFVNKLGDRQTDRHIRLFSCYINYGYKLRLVIVIPGNGNFQVLMASWSLASLLTIAVPSGYFTFFLLLQFVLSLSAQSAFTISW